MGHPRSRLHVAGAEPDRHSLAPFDRIEQLEEAQKQLLTQVKTTPYRAEPATENSSRPREYQIAQGWGRLRRQPCQD